MTHGLAKFVVKKGEKGKPLKFTLKNDDGSIFDPTGYSPILLTVWNAGSPTYKFQGTCSIINGPTGRVDYTIAATDFDTVGDYEAEVELRSGSTIIEITDTFAIEVKKSSPPAP